MNEFGMDNSGHKRTLAATHLKLTKDENDISVDQSMYRSMIRSLLYLTASRQDITFVIGVCVGTKGVSQLRHLSFDDNKVLKIINWIC